MQFDYIWPKDFKSITLVFAKDGHGVYECYKKLATVHGYFENCVTVFMSITCKKRRFPESNG